MLDKIVNTSILRNPLNWGVVWIVLLLTAHAFMTITHATFKSGGCGCSDANSPD